MQNKNIEEFIASLSQEQLKYVLKNFLEISPEFVRYANDLVKTNDVDALYHKIKNEITLLIKDHTYRGFIDWRACSDLCTNLENLLDFHIEDILSGKPVTALKILLEFHKAALYLAQNADDSDGGVSCLLSHTEHYLESQVTSTKEIASTKDKNQCYTLLLKTATSKMYDGWTDEIFTLLGLCTHLITKTNANKLLSAIDDMSKNHPKYSGYYYQDNFKILRIHIIEKLEGRQTAYEKIFTEHLSDGTLQLALSWMNAENNLTEALRIIDIALNNDSLHINKIVWIKKQLEIYTKLKDKNGILKCTRELLLSGDIEFYNSYKKQLTALGTWEKEKPQLLLQLAECMYLDKYLIVLDKEKEYDKLLDIIASKNYYIRSYAKALYAYNPKETNKIYQDFIFREANVATNRNQYKKVCNYLKEYAKVCGQEEGFNLATNLLLSFRRKPAFIEEISAIHKRWLGLK